MTLTREQFLEKIAALPTTEVDVEGLGPVRIRRMSGAERARFELKCKGQDNATLERIRAIIVAETVIDAAGDPMFTADDVEQLNAGDGVALDRIFEAASRHNGLMQGDLEELAGN